MADSTSLDIGNVKSLGRLAHQDSDYVAYVNRVVADGGYVINPTYVYNSIIHAKDNGYWSSLKFWTSPSFGVKKDGSNAVSKLYDLKSNDLIEPVGSSQPTWTSNQQNGKATIYYSGNKLLYIYAAIYPATGVRSTIFCANYSRTISNETIICQGGNGYNGCRYNIGTSTTLLYVEGRNQLYSISRASAGSMNLYSLIMSGTTMYSHSIYRNASLKTFSSGTDGTLNTDSSSFVVGRSSYAESEFFQGYVGDIIVFNTNISDPVRTAIESYQNAYYAIY